MIASARKIITIAIADDHTMMRSLLVKLITSNSSNYKISIEAANGKDLLEQLEYVGLTDIILLDISMPVMNGFETMVWLKKKYRNPVVIALTGYHDDSLVLRMMALGIKGYVLKTQSDNELLHALDTVAGNRNYFSNQVNEMLHHDADKTLHQRIASLKVKQITFLKHLCSGISYNEIAAKMNVSPYTVEGYKETLLAKFELKNKTELVALAFRHKIVE